jgi:hypothetical protein
MNKYKIDCNLLELLLPGFFGAYPNNAGDAKFASPTYYFRIAKSLNS